MLAWRDGDDKFSFRCEFFGLELISCENRLGGRAIGTSNRRERVILTNLVVSPPRPHVCRYASDVSQVFVLCSRGKSELKVFIFWRDIAQQAGIQVLKIGNRTINAIGHETKIDGIIDLDGVVVER